MKNLTCTLLVCLLLTVISDAQTGSTENASTNSVTASKKQRPVFRAGKDQVAEAQMILKQKGLYSGESDGKFNDSFRNAISDFQAKNALKKTGTLNRATLEKLGIALTDKQKEYPVNPASLDTSGNNKPKRARAFRPTKEQIASVQTKLSRDGSFSGAANGKYSKDFRSAIKEFQGANGLKRKGSLNRATLEKMGIALSEEQMAIPVNESDFATAKSGGKRRGPVFRSTKEQISEVQRMLKAKGLYGGAETGKLNPETRAAIGQWQTQNGVKKTGTLNKETLMAMKIELTDRQKEM